MSIARPSLTIRDFADALARAVSLRQLEELTHRWHELHLHSDDERAALRKMWCDRWQDISYRE